MQEYYPENSDFFEKILAQISIYIDSDTKEVYFACDWKDDDDGILSISSILHQLKNDNLIDKIIASINEQCVKDNRLNDMYKINLILDTTTNNQKHDNDIVIRPRDNK